MNSKVGPFTLRYFPQMFNKIHRNQVSYLINFLWTLDEIKKYFWIDNLADCFDHWYNNLQNINEGQKKRFFALYYKKDWDELVKYTDQFKIKRKI